MGGAETHAVAGVLATNHCAPPASAGATASGNAPLVVPPPQEADPHQKVEQGQERADHGGHVGERGGVQHAVHAPPLAFTDNPLRHHEYLGAGRGIKLHWERHDLEEETAINECLLIATAGWPGFQGLRREMVVLVTRLGSALDLIGPKAPSVSGLGSTRPASSCVDCALTLPAAVSLWAWQRLPTVSGACVRSYSANRYSTRSRSDVKRCRR